MTGIYLPACFPPEAKRVFLRACVGACLFILAGAAQAFVLEIHLGSLRHALVAMDGLVLYIDDAQRDARLDADELVIGKHRWQNVRLHCRHFDFSGEYLECSGGRLALPGLHERLNVNLELDLGASTGSVVLKTPQEEKLSARLAADGVLSVRLEEMSVSWLKRLVPELAAYGVEGRFSGQLEVQPQAGGARAVQFEGELRKGAFSSADGLHAAQDVVAALALYGRYQEGVLDGRIALDWREGEAYVHPVYLVASGDVRLDGRFAVDGITVREARLNWPGIRGARASGRWRSGEGLRTASVSVEQAELAVVGPHLLAPLLSPARADSLVFDGTLQGQVTFDEHGLQAADLDLDSVSIDLNEGDLGVRAVSGNVPWRREGWERLRLQVAGAYYQSLDMGGFALEGQLGGQRLEIPRLAVPVLDGELVVSDLGLRRDRAGWYGRARAHISPVSMNRLTRAVGVPEMAGRLSASLPELRFAPGELSMDGALVISVFDGYLYVSDLQVLEPFGVASHLYSNVAVRHLDLAQLSSTFDFGTMTGYVDADVRGLELSRWRPVQFDAQLRSSPGRYPRRISQRAVENIGALGGPGVGMALQRGFLRFFDSFGYREIGLSCVLKRGVCEMAGIDGEVREDGSFTIIRGGGIPALNVVGYNHRVDWNLLLDRLRRVVDTNATPTVQ